MEKLYNGIVLSDTWPPKTGVMSDSSPMRMPYLENPPETIPIDVGRQLFVDDFLLAEKTLATVYHAAKKRSDNPIFRPETDMERETLAGAGPKSGGVWYDEAEKKHKMWYEAGWLNKMAYAESDDGLHWTRPVLDVEHPTNRVMPGLRPDSTAVILDPDAKDGKRWKAFLRPPGGLMPGYALVSEDGVHWSEPKPTTPLFDRSTIFYNPFRKKWVYSIRSFVKSRGGWPRARDYRECDDYLAGATWREDEAVPWLATDVYDLPEPGLPFTPQLYNFDAVAYESVMLGMFQIHFGPENEACECCGRPKGTELQAAYSRDGFHFQRPCREPIVAAARDKDAWDRGYVQSVGGGVTIHGDELWLYYIGFQGDESNTDADWHKNGMYANFSTGVATLRRDGFASLDGRGFALTRPLLFSGSRLFVNAKATNLRAELLDADGKPIEGMASEPFTGDSTKAELRFPSSIGARAGKPTRLRFTQDEGSLYAFWMAKDARGESGGFRAAGEVF